MSDIEIAISIEELCVMKMTQSNDNNSNVVSTREPRNVINFSKEESSNMTCFDKVMMKGEEAKAREQTDKPKIQKVAGDLRDNDEFKKFYEPRAISIGPIHHKHENLQLAQQYKLRLATKFIKESGKTTEEVYVRIKAEMEALKLLFDPEVIENYSEEELSWMLFLDGCSTLQFIDGVMNRKMRKYNIRSGHIALMQQDLFLLENQIPFKVLNLLIDSSNAKDELRKSITRFLQTNVLAPSHMCESNVIDIEKEDPTHLLELLQKFAVSSPRKRLAKFFPRSFIKKRHVQHSRRNVQELKAAGINLKPSVYFSLRDIDFTPSRFSGLLKLSPLVVDESTGPKLLNMIAYEMCPDNFRTDYEVSGYVSFLDSLIAQSNDVQELRSANILYNLLGSDQDVALLFNDIAAHLVPGPFYDNVICEIQRYYDNRMAIRLTTWMVEAYYTYFKSPWTIFAFLGALIALALTIVQTWYAINPPSDKKSEFHICFK